MEYNNLVATINQLNETNKILQNNIATKDRTITELKSALTILPEPSLVVVIPSSDELDHNNGKENQIKQYSYYFILR